MKRITPLEDRRQVVTRRRCEVQNLIASRNKGGKSNDDQSTNDRPLKRGKKSKLRKYMKDKKG